jgi:alpha-glucosidase (family GH31 glycosyl hydrolase)
MTREAVFQTLSLRHEPYGEMHPYIPLPYERSPRDPIAGQPVEINIETGHNPSAKEVWCVWQVDGDPLEHKTEAVSSGGTETVDHWKVELPPFKRFEVVRYRLFACSDGQPVESQEFTFSAASWEEVVSLVGVEKNGQDIKIKLATTYKDLFIQLQFEPDPQGKFSLRFSAVHEPGFFASTTPLNDPPTVEWGDLRLTIQNEPFRLELSRKSDGLRLQTTAPLGVLVNAAGWVEQYRIGFDSPADEAFYGFGERFNALDQRGNLLDNYVYGQYTGQGKRSYIPVPFFLSSRGYGMWLETERQAEFDLAAAEKDRWVITGHAEEKEASLELKFFFQQNPLAIIRAFTDQTGKSPLPPSWVFGVWMSSNDWNSQAEVLRQLHETQRYSIPASVLVIEAWSDEINFYIWNDARYQLQPASKAYRLQDYIFPPEGHWPNPKAMIDELHQAGLRVVLWQNPAIKQAEPREHLDEALNKIDQEYAIQQGFVVTKADGTPHRVEPHMPWFVGSLVLDFTNPKAAEWWLAKRDYLVTELGVDGFKTDGGEHIWDTETRFSDGMRGRRRINTYPVTYERAYKQFMQARRGNDYVLFSRAGYTGAQQNPCHWAGDEISTWDAFRASVRAMFNAGICGIPFMGWDIAGFSGPLPGSELYLRATAFSALCPIMQYHSDVNAQRKPSRDRTPWNMQEQTGDVNVIPVFRKFANLRMNLLPYILNQARESSLSGFPLMRALPLEYPKDPICRQYPYEYLFGEALLVAPVMEEGITTWAVYLPEGEWRDIWSGEVQLGPKVIEVNVPLDRIPVFQRRGSLLPLNLDQSGELGSPMGNATDKFDHLTLQIFPGERMEADFLQSADREPATITVETHDQDGSLIVQLPALSKDVDLVIFVNKPESVMANDKLLSRLEQPVSPGQDSGWYWNSQKQEIRLHIPASPEKTRITIQNII